MRMSGWVAYAGGHEVLDGLNRLNPSPGSCGRAIQCSRGAGEVELSFQGPVLQEPVDKAGVKDISRPGGIDHGHGKGGLLI